MGQSLRKLLLVVVLMAPLAGLAVAPLLVANEAAPRAAGISHAHLDPFERVRACQQQSNQAHADQRSAQTELDQAKSELETAERDRRQLPARISDLESKLEALDSEMATCRAALHGALTEHTAVATEAPQRVDAFRRDATNRAAVALELALRAVDQARLQREELRRQRGQAAGRNQVK